MIITSTSNLKIKQIKALQDKKTRCETGFALIEGEKMLIEALNATVVTTIVASVNVSAEILDQITAQKIDLIECNSAVINYLSLQVNPSGIIAVIKQKKAEFNYDLKGNFIVLDRVRDPGNLGTIIRTAAASNFKTILLIGCADKYNSKVLNSSMGAIFKVDIFDITYEDLGLLKEHNKNMMLLATEMNGKNIFEYSVFKTIDYGIMLGSESHGLSKECLNVANDIISIPMQNNVESLNVSIAGAICMYQIQSVKNK